VGILAASDQILAEEIQNYIIMGELSLDGSLQPIKGGIPLLFRQGRGFKGIILPIQNESCHCR
jgi:magnesium chelatase family protein